MPSLPPNPVPNALLNLPSPGPSSLNITLDELRSLMRQLWDIVCDVCGPYLLAPDATQVAKTRRDFLLNLGGSSLEWDNIDPTALVQMAGSIVETSHKLGAVIEGVRVSLGKLHVFAQRFGGANHGGQSLAMASAWLMCERLAPLMGRLGVAQGLGTTGVAIVERRRSEGDLYQSHWEESKRSEAVRELRTLLRLWTEMEEWLDQLIVLREAVVSVREVVADERIENGLDAARPTEDEGDEGSAEMDLGE